MSVLLKILRAIGREIRTGFVLLGETHCVVPQGAYAPELFDEIPCGEDIGEVASPAGGAARLDGPDIEG